MLIYLYIADDIIRPITIIRAHINITEMDRHVCRFRFVCCFSSEYVSSYSDDRGKQNQFLVHEITPSYQPNRRPISSI